MDLMQLRAMAKINLGLDVVRKREDGYHEVRMIMQTIRMFDRVTVYRIPEPEIRISSNLHFLPVNKNNIAYKAARMMLESQPVRGGVSISLQKRIPVAAGMAGGSADAAAVLYAMNRIFYMGYTLEELMDFGLRLGADVPYCLMRGTALAEGIGEELTRLPACPPCYVVIAKPAISVSTRFVYENLHLDETTRHPDIYGLADAICRQDLYGMLPYMGNVLESVTIPAYPIIGEIKERFMENGALISLMSGSGPTVFALFDNYEMALRAKEALLEWGQVPLVYVTDLYRVREETPVNCW